MKIKLLCQDIEFVRVDSNSAELHTKLTGHAKVFEGKAFFDNKDPFPVIIHEIFHFWLYRIGMNQQERFEEDVVCDLPGFFVDQLMRENGDDILLKIKEFVTDDQSKN